jgi:hypothetical protein
MRRLRLTHLQRHFAAHSNTEDVRRRRFLHSSLWARHIRNEMIIHPAGLKSAALAVAVSPARYRAPVPHPERTRARKAPAPLPRPFSSLGPGINVCATAQFRGRLAALTADVQRRHRAFLAADTDKAPFSAVLSRALETACRQPTCPGAPHDLLSPSGNALVVASGARTLKCRRRLPCRGRAGEALAWPVWRPESDGSHAAFADSTWRAHPQVGADASRFFTANVCFRPETWRDESTIPRQRNSAGWMIGYIGR